MGVCVQDSGNVWFGTVFLKLSFMHGRSTHAYGSWHNHTRCCSHLELSCSCGARGARSERTDLDQVRHGAGAVDPLVAEVGPHASLTIMSFLPFTGKAQRAHAESRSAIILEKMIVQSLAQWPVWPQLWQRPACTFAFASSAPPSSIAGEDTGVTFGLGLGEFVCIHPAGRS